MRSHRILEGFPIHLLLPPNSATGTTLLLYDEMIGELQIQAVPNGTRDLIIILPPSLESKPPEKLFDRTEYRNATLIFAEPERLPLNQGTIDEIILCRSYENTAGFEQTREILSKLLKRDGVLAIIDTNYSEPPTSSTKTRVTHYFVRSPNNREYFVTGNAAPSMSNWPFHSLSLGIITKLKLYVSLLGYYYFRLKSEMPVRISILAPEDLGPLISAWSGEDEIKSQNNFNSGLFVKKGWNAILFGLKNSQIIVKFPLIDVIVERMADSAKTIYSLGESISTQLQTKIPAISGNGEIGSQYYWEETLCPGIPATAIRFTRNWKQHISESGFKFLLALHQETSKQSLIDMECFAILFPQDDIDELYSCVRKYNSSFDLSHLLALIQQVICNHHLPLVRTHGDFWPGNILVTEDAELEAIIDWDASHEHSWPVIDLLNLLTFQSKHIGYWHLGPQLTRRLAPKKLKRWELRLITKYFSGMNVPEDLWICFVAVYWLERCIQWVKTDSNGEPRACEKWVQRNIINTAPVIMSQMKSQYCI